MLLYTVFFLYGITWIICIVENSSAREIHIILIVLQNLVTRGSPMTTVAAGVLI